RWKTEVRDPKHKAGVDRALKERFELAFRAEAMDVEVYLRKTLAKFPDHKRKRGQNRPRHPADRQPAGFAALHTPRPRHGLLALLKERAGLAQENLSDTRQLDAPPRPMKQYHP